MAGSMAACILLLKCRGGRLDGWLDGRLGELECRGGWLDDRLGSLWSEFCGGWLDGWHAPFWLECCGFMLSCQ